VDTYSLYIMYYQEYIIFILVAASVVFCTFTKIGTIVIQTKGVRDHLSEPTKYSYSTSTVKQILVNK